MTDDRRRFVQVVRGALDDVAAEHELDFDEAAVLTRAVLSASWQTHAVTGWTTTGYAADWGLSWRRLQRAVDRLEELGLVRCTAARGHAGELEVLAYDRLVRLSGLRNGPGRSRDSAGASESHNRDIAIGNRESAGAQSRERRSDQPEHPVDIEDVDAAAAGGSSALLSERWRRLTARYVDIEADAQRPKGFRKTEASFRRGVRDGFTARHSSDDMADLLAEYPDAEDADLLHLLEPDNCPRPRYSALNADSVPDAWRGLDGDVNAAAAS